MRGKVIFKLKLLGVSDQLLGLTLSLGKQIRSVHVHVGKTIRKSMRDIEIYDSNGIIVPMDPSVRLFKLDCPTQENISANHKE